MSTRSILARSTGEGTFRGVYMHSDGYPTWMGKQIWTILHEHFHGDLKNFLAETLDKHSGGWSVFGERCYCHNNHRRTSEPDMILTEEEVEESTCEWLWAFDEDQNKLFVRDLNNKEDVAVIDLAGPEPSWEIIECGENFERCHHYAWKHGLLPRTSNLSTQTWLERRPLEMRDAVAVVVDGKRYRVGGSAGDADFLNRSNFHPERKPFPSGTWVQSLIAGNGKRIDVPIAKRLPNNKYVPLSNVKWVMPPTVNNPQETIVEAK